MHSTELYEQLHKVSREGGEAHDTQLLNAAKNEQINRVKHLLESRHLTLLDINIRDEKGNSPLLLAAAANNAEIVNCLVSCGADATLQNVNSDSALHFASPELLKILHKSIHTGDAKHSLLHAAWLADSSLVSQIIASESIDVDCRNADLLTPLILASRDVGLLPECSFPSESSVGILNYLLDHKADPNAQDKKGKSALHYVSLINHQITQQVANLLLQHGANPNLHDVDENSPLHLAACSGNQDVMSCLIFHKANPNDRGHAGQTPLHISARCKHKACCVILLKHGAHANIVDDHGRSPVDVAESDGIREILDDAWTEMARPRCIKIEASPRKPNKQQISEPASKVVDIEAIEDSDLAVEESHCPKKRKGKKKEMQLRRKSRQRIEKRNLNSAKMKQKEKKQPQLKMPVAHIYINGSPSRPCEVAFVPLKKDELAVDQNASALTPSKALPPLGKMQKGEIICGQSSYESESVGLCDYRDDLLFEMDNLSMDVHVDRNSEYRQIISSQGYSPTHQIKAAPNLSANNVEREKICTQGLPRNDLADPELSGCEPEAYDGDDAHAENDNMMTENHGLSLTSVKSTLITNQICDVSTLDVIHQQDAMDPGGENVLRHQIYEEKEVERFCNDEEDQNGEQRTNHKSEQLPENITEDDEASSKTCGEIIESKINDRTLMTRIVLSPRESLFISDSTNFESSSDVQTLGHGAVTFKKHQQEDAKRESLTEQDSIDQFIEKELRRQQLETDCLREVDSFIAKELNEEGREISSKEEQKSDCQTAEIEKERESVNLGTSPQKSAVKVLTQRDKCLTVSKLTSQCHSNGKENVFKQSETDRMSAHSCFSAKQKKRKEKDLLLEIVGAGSSTICGQAMTLSHKVNKFPEKHSLSKKNKSCKVSSDAGEQPDVSSPETMLKNLPIMKDINTSIFPQREEKFSLEEAINSPIDSPVSLTNQIIDDDERRMINEILKIKPSLSSLASNKEEIVLNKPPLPRKSFPNPIQTNSDFVEKSKQKEKLMQKSKEKKDGEEELMLTLPRTVSDLNSEPPFVVSGGRRTSCQSTESADSGTLSQMMQTGQQIFWKKGDVLGRGAFGTVWHGLTDIGQMVAVKRIQLDSRNLKEAEAAFDKVRNEVELLKALHHRNIVGYYGTCMDGNFVSIFMEFVSGGSISNILAKFGPLRKPLIVKYARQLLKGIAYVHEQHIIHRDIKGANVLVEPNGNVKLIDFGCAKVLAMNVGMQSGATTAAGLTPSLQGTPYWMAPEVVKQHAHDYKSDIWSIGCTIFEMATTNPPFHEMPPAAAMFAIGSNTAMPCLESDGKWQNAQDFLNQCYIVDCCDRPTAKQLLQHPFITAADNH